MTTYLAFVTGIVTGFIVSGVLTTLALYAKDIAQR